MNSAPRPERSDSTAQVHPPGVEASARLIASLEAAIGTTVVGQEGVIQEAVACVLAGGHGLLEGPPGLAKTLLVRSLAHAVGLSFSRIQFTPDLLPADITGTDVLVEDGNRRSFEFRSGPLFGNIVLADEINRATPRTQAALIEAMAEGTVHSGGTRHALPQPFSVLATQNPIEHEGTFPLPEAQLDRFLLKIVVRTPSEEALVEILSRTDLPEPTLPEPVLSREQLTGLIDEARKVALAEPLARQVSRIVAATDVTSPRCTDAARRNLRLGISPRGGEAVCRVARVAALRAGRSFVSADDLAWALRPALRHRLLPSFDAEARGLIGDTLLRDVLHDLPKLPSEVEEILQSIAE